MELVIHFIALYKEWNFAFTEWCLSSVTINKSFVEYISRFAECTSILGAALNEPSVSRSVLDACQQQAKKAHGQLQVIHSRMSTRSFGIIWGVGICNFGLASVNMIQS
jgi:hypothetical protein